MSLVLPHSGQARTLSASTFWDPDVVSASSCTPPFLLIGSLAPFLLRGGNIELLVCEFFWVFNCGPDYGYGEDTGPMMSKTLPIILRFSSMTAVPSFGGFSTFMMRFCDGVTLRTLPNLCNTLPSRKTSLVNVIRLIKFSAFHDWGLYS